MHILLPEYYSSKKGYIVGNTLLLNKILNFEKIMYELTYEIYGKKCVYCKRKLTEKNKTLDHLYPRAIGGVSITNNLKPSCQKCNSAKGDKTEKQFYDSKIISKKESKLYKTNINKWKEQIYKTQGFYLPKDWYFFVPTNDIKGIVNLDYPLGKSYYNALGFYSTYNHFPKPIIIDKDFNLLDGYSILQLAKNKNIESIPAIWCENVRF